MSDTKAPITREQFEMILESAFADLLGFSKQDWQDVEDIAAQAREAGLFKADPIKCTAAGFVIFFEAQGYLDDDRIPDVGLI